MEIKGKVIQVLPIQEGVSKNNKSWKKATIVVEYGDNPQYPKRVVLDNMKNADSFAALAVGTEGTFHIEVESREFNGRWYSSVNCWKWETSPQPQQAPAQQSQAQPQTPKDDMDDDLPF